MLQVLSDPERGFSDFMAQIEEIKSETRGLDDRRARAITSSGGSWVPAGT